MQEIKTEKFSISNLIIRFIQGLFLGFSSGLPIFQCHNLKESMGLKNLKFIKQNETKRSENEIQGSFFIELLYLLKYRTTYFIGVLIGFLLFFFIPMTQLSINYKISIFGGIIAFCIPFMIFEAYKLKKNLKRRKRRNKILISGLISIIIGFGLPFLFNLFPISIENETILLLFFVLMTFIGVLLLNLTGLSIMTPLYLTGTYFTYCDTLNDFLYKHTNITMVILGIIASLCAILISLITKRELKIGKDIYGSINFGIYLGVIIFTAITHIDPPYISEISTELAQYLTIGTSIFACLLVSFALTIHGYKKFNKKDYKELNDCEGEDALR